MTFEQYIGYLGVITLNIQYSSTSTRTLEEVKEIVVNRVNRISKENNNIDTICYLTDQHNGNKYIAYSDGMLEKYPLDTNWVLDLDMEKINAFLIGSNQQTKTIANTEIIREIEYARLDSIEVEVLNKEIEIVIDEKETEVIL